MLRKIIKKALACFSVFCSSKLQMNSDEAAAILKNASPAPKGSCFTENKRDYNYDLQLIIPAYNQEHYIRECIESTVNQVTEFTVLVTVINDGSTDETGNILRDVEASNSSMGNIKLEIIGQENRGFSGARNRALKQLKGRYIAFLDSDDVLPPGALSKLMKAANDTGADIVQGSWYTFTNSSIGERNYHFVPPVGVQGDNRMAFSGYAWGKVYRAEVFEHFCFPEGFWYEDTPLTFILAAMNYRFVSIPDVVYGYRINPNGISKSSVGNIKSLDSYYITEECLKEFPLFGLQYDKRAYEYVLRQSMINSRRFKGLSKEVREAAFVLTCELILKYFPDMTSEDKYLKKAEKAIKNRQMKKLDMLAYSVW